MKRKIINGIIVVIVVLGIAFAMSGFFPFTLAIPISLVWMVWKKKTVSIYLKALKTFLLIAGISGIMLIVFLGGVIIYYAIYGLEGMDLISDDIAHYIGFSLLGMFNIATSGSLVIYFKGRRKTKKKDTEIGQGL